MEIRKNRPLAENQNKQPNDGQSITLANEGGTWDEREIVDAGFLELVRRGVKAANNLYILESLPEVDVVIKQTIPGKGADGIVIP